MTGLIRLGLVGFGKIAQSQHLPAIASHPELELAAIVTLGDAVECAPTYASVREMFASHPEIEGVVMCQPPSVRFDQSLEALIAGKHVFLEKPPGITVGEVRQLQSVASANGKTLFTGWHSRWAEPVELLRKWCEGRKITRVQIEWKEDVHLWHPGQDWIWERGGFGVLDPGINALSILTAAIPGPMRVLSAFFEQPENKFAPIASRLVLEAVQGASIEAEFDWRQTGPQLWRMEFEAADGHYVFQQGVPEGAESDDDPAVLSNEYEAMYAHFIKLIRSGQSDVDCVPLEIIADAALIGVTSIVAPFNS